MRPSRFRVPRIEETPKLAARQNDRQENQRADRAAHEHQHHWRQLPHPDPDEQVGDSPDHAHRDEQQKAPAGHAEMHLK